MLSELKVIYNYNQRSDKMFYRFVKIAFLHFSSNRNMLSSPFTVWKNPFKCKFQIRLI